MHNILSSVAIASESFFAKSPNGREERGRTIAESSGQIERIDENTSKQIRRAIVHLGLGKIFQD